MADLFIETVAAVWANDIDPVDGKHDTVALDPVFDGLPDPQHAFEQEQRRQRTEGENGDLDSECLQQEAPSADVAL